jgi:hypothetical protein
MRDVQSFGSAGYTVMLSAVDVIDFAGGERDVEASAHA